MFHSIFSTYLNGLASLAPNQPDQNLRPLPSCPTTAAATMVKISVLADCLKSIYNAEKRGKRQVRRHCLPTPAGPPSTITRPSHPPTTHRPLGF